MQLQRVEYFHSKSFIHRDVKPDNFTVGRDKKKGVIYIIDYGLAKRYRNPKTGEHIPYRDNKSFTGTARYASINTHLDIEQSRRDDLEGIGYVLMYFNKGKLPWQGINAKTKKEKYDKIRDIKVSITVENLCKGFPKEFTDYLNYCHKLNFDEKPDYSYARKLFKDLLIKKGFDYDYVYDWLVQVKGSPEKIIEAIKPGVIPTKITEVKKEIPTRKDHAKEEIKKQKIVPKKSKQEIVPVKTVVKQKDTIKPRMINTGVKSLVKTTGVSAAKYSKPYQFICIYISYNVIFPF